MKVIAAMVADFERSFLGLASTLNTELRGETVIRRTIQRLRAAGELASVHLLVDGAQEAVARAAVAGLEVTVETHHAGAPPWTPYVASGRKWSLDSWRGGLAGTTVFDEFAHPWLLEALARREGADAIVDLPSAAPLLDPARLDDLIRHFAKVQQDSRIALVQTAPGLSGIIYQPEFLGSLAGSSQPPGRIMSYRPDDPHRDVLLQSCLMTTDAVISHGWGRCIADTSTAMSRLERLLDDLSATGPDSAPGALDISRWLQADRNAPSELPREIEVEITTQDPLPNSRLRPRGAALGRAGEMSLETFRRVVDGLGGSNDRLLVLGGFGDPLLHPQWPQFVRYAREAGILGVAVRTTGVNLDAAATDTLLGLDVDVLNILLDAATAATYQRMHGADHFDRAVANIDQLCAVQHQRQCPRPLIVCEMIKTRESLDEMEPFYDRWVRKTASAVITGPSRYAGRWPDLAVMNMAPPGRRICSRLFSRTVILADGRMTLCDQDFAGTQAIGSVDQQPLGELWHAAGLAETRAGHLRSDYSALPLCSNCDEWHRP